MKSRRLFGIDGKNLFYIVLCVKGYGAVIERQLEKEGTLKPINKRLAVVNSQNVYSILIFYLKDGKIDTSDFSLPPWYEKGLRKYGM
jgi:hypothetical protein